MTNQQKPDVVRMFLRGTDVKDVAVFFCVSTGTIQTVLREALVQLSDLVVSQSTHLRHRDEPMAPSHDEAL